MKFYDSANIPSPRRVRIVIAEKSVEIETVQIDLKTNEQLGAAFRQINPRCTVPALVLDDGSCLRDSVAISLYLEALYPEPNLFGYEALEKAFIMSWLREVENDGIMAVAECFRNQVKGLKNRALTGPVDYGQIPELAERGRQRTRHCLHELDQRLAQSEYLAGARYTAADLTALVFVDFCQWIKESIPDEAIHLQRWYDQVSARPGVVA